MNVMATQSLPPDEHLSQAERRRLSAEMSRDAAEQDRVAAETARQSAENERHAAEQARASADSARDAVVESVAQTASSLRETLTQMKALEDTRRKARQLPGHDTDVH